MKFNGSPAQFESALQSLCKSMGFLVQLTKHSHDGGVDLVVEDTTPIRGGRYIVQAKRYEGGVGEPVIRDLYGTLMHEGAVKAILITTGYFTADARTFSRGKPIELVDGDALEKLVDQFHLSLEFSADPKTEVELQEHCEHFKSVLMKLRDDFMSDGAETSFACQAALVGVLGRRAGNVSDKQVGIQEVEEALKRIEKASYGVCECCRQRIGLTRLGAMPFARLCLKCQSQSEGYGKEVTQ